MPIMCKCLDCCVEDSYEKIITNRSRYNQTNNSCLWGNKHIVRDIKGGM